MKTIYLMRHGQTLFNEQHKIQGWCDSPLTLRGIKQAQIARRHLEAKGISFDAAFSSTSERACDTLELVTDLRYTRVKGLREWNFGRLEGEGEHLNPQLPYRDFFVQYGGEAEDSFRNRISETIKDIADKTEAERILIVSHGAALAQFYLTHELNSNVKREGRIHNCSILEYRYEDDVFCLQEIINHDFSEIDAHLIVR